MLRGVWRGTVLVLGVWAFAAAGLRFTVVPSQHCPAVDAGAARAGALAAGDWIARVQRPDGSYLYEYDAGGDGVSGDYNIVRHAGVTMSLYQLAAEGDGRFLPAADRAAAWMEATLLRRGDWAALFDARDRDAPLGASALMLAGLAQRRIATADPRHDTLMRELGRFMVVMQLDDGAFLETWEPARGGPNPDRRSKYATGEAFWALTLMHRIFPAEGWDRPARAVASYLALHRDRVERQKFPPWADQWAAYGLAEMASWTLTDDEIQYARSLAERFGLLVRVESGRREGGLSRGLRGPQARAAGMGTWGEGLTSLWRLASIDPRMADMREKLGERAACTAGMLAKRQLDAGEAQRFARPGLVRGAWLDEGITRMDDQQHALSALLRSEAILAERGKP